MSSGWFVTGTDTGVGKTCVSLALLQALKCSDLAVAAMKPVASGCTRTPEGLRNDDAESLLRACPPAFTYAQVNPYAFEPAIAPHLAAEAVNARIEVPVVAAAYRELTARADAVVVEGVGGWLVPINDRQTMQDVALALGLPVILVVGIRLGCLNHALLSATAIRESGLELAGWVANRVDNTCENPDENVLALQQRLAAPLLADFPFAEDTDWPHRQYRRIDLQPLRAS